jgi:oxygen-independent coproporphyrinogen-3 oxidase
MTSSVRVRAQSIAAGLDLAPLWAERLDRRRDEYFLNISYPPLQAMPSVRAADIYPSDGARPNRSVAAYVHIPFCRAPCSYCHYFKTFRATEHTIDRYLDLLDLELSLHVRNLGAITVASLYVGGGTPSYLSPIQIERLFRILHQSLVIPDRTEISFEVHPENATAELFAILRGTGVNRISLGVESLDDRVLAGQQRRHTAADALRAYDLAILSGFDNVNVDLIYGLRGQTLSSWDETLAGTASLAPASLCAYYLRLKQGTPEYHRYLRDPAQFPSDHELLVMHIMTCEAMEALGYQQDIVDWFIREPRFFHTYQQHNWQRTDEIELLGIGASAYSYVNGYQYYNAVNMDDYASRLARGELPTWRGERLADLGERMRRALVLGLKTRINRTVFRRTYGIDMVKAFPETLARLEEIGVVEVGTADVELTYVGKLFADEVGREFYSPDMRSRMRAIEPSTISTTLPKLNVLSDGQDAG